MDMKHQLQKKLEFYEDSKNDTERKLNMLEGLKYQMGRM